MLEKTNNEMDRAASQATDQSKKSILIVEDNEVDSKIVQRIVDKLGHRILTATNGKVGLEAVRTERPDLIILDCEMPVMGGVEMCEMLRAEDETVNIPVLFLTAGNTPQNIIEAFELDAENYLSKPINSKILIQQIEQILEDQSS